MSDGRRASERRRQREAQDLAEAAKDSADSAAPDDVTQFGGAPIVDDGPGQLDGPFGGGGALEVTQVSERPPKPRPRGGALVNMSTGDKVVLSQTPFPLARHSLSPAPVRDPAVSREHAVLTYDNESAAWVIADAGSKSGTALNGELLSAPGVLRHGDVIELGESTFRFRWDETIPEYVDPEAAAEEMTAAGVTVLTRLTVARKGNKKAAKKDKKPGSGKKLLIIFAVLFGLLFVGVTTVVAGYFIWRAQQDPAAEQAQVKELLSQARALIKRLRLDDAQARLDAVFAFEPENADAQSLQRSLKSEREAQAALAEGKKLFEALKYDEARDALRKIPDSSGFAKKRDALLAQIRMENAQGVLAEIKALIDAGDLDAARKALERFLKKSPSDPLAATLLERLVALENRPKPKNRSLERARAAFAVGNVKQARIVAQAEAKRGSSDAAKYVSNVDAFSSAFKSGQAALRKKNGAVALNNLDKAYGLAKSLAAGKGSSYKRQVGEKLADALYLVAIIDRASGKECAWGKNIVRAAALDAGDSKIKAQKRKAIAKAKAALERAKAKRSSAPAKARAIAKDGLCFTSGASKTGRALKKIAK